MTTVFERPAALLVALVLALAATLATGPAWADDTADPPGDGQPEDSHVDAASDEHDHKDAATDEHDNGAHADNEHAASKPNPLPVGPDLAIFAFIVFAVLVLILWKFAWAPIMEGLAKRESGIAAEIAEAKSANESAQKQLAAYEQRLATAQDEVRELLDQAKKEAESQKATILADAQAVASAEKNRSVQAIEAAKNQALGELKERSVDLAVELAGKIVRKQLKAEDHATLIQESLQRFPSEN
jgi:F-type H+-transporting ATPase subunit b